MDQRVHEIVQKILNEIRFIGTTLEDYGHTQETIELLSLEELEEIYKEILPKPLILRKHYHLPMDTDPDDILFVNNNPGQEIKLIVGGGGEYTQWYYGQTLDGRFYERTVSGFDRNENIYYLDVPLNPIKVCSVNY
jgi:hypothetical protein